MLSSYLYMQRCYLWLLHIFTVKLKTTRQMGIHILSSHIAFSGRMEFFLRRWQIDLHGLTTVILASTRRMLWTCATAWMQGNHFIQANQEARKYCCGQQRVRFLVEDEINLHLQDVEVWRGYGWTAYWGWGWGFYFNAVPIKSVASAGEERLSVLNSFLLNTRVRYS